MNSLSSTKITNSTLSSPSSYLPLAPPVSNMLLVDNHTLVFSFLFLHFIGISVYATTFTLVNRCTYTVWPATLTNAGATALPTSATGFSLLPGATYSLPIPTSWSGRLWARTLCSTNQPTGNKFSCVTGDCRTGSIQCSGSGATPPATLAEFTLSGSGGLDFYDVSLVDGYNLPLVIRPVSGSGNCSAAGCMAELNESCPAQLRVVAPDGASGANAEGVACKSACDAFGEPQYCCSGAYSTPDKCKPSWYSEYFKKACPSAYSYAYDDASSTFTCSGGDYVITFCPTTAATDKSSGSESPVTSPPASFYLPINASASLFPSLIIVLLMLAFYWISTL